MRTYVTGKSSDELWESLIMLTDMIYREMKDYGMPVTREMLNAYYEKLR